MVVSRGRLRDVTSGSHGGRRVTATGPTTVRVRHNGRGIARESPTLQGEERKDPRKPNADEGDGQVEEGHRVVKAVSHRRKRDLLGRKDEDDAAAGEAQCRQRFRRRPRREDAGRWSEVEEEVSEETEACERAEEEAPKGVDVDLELIRLVMCCHRDTRHSNHERWEWVEREARGCGRGDFRHRTTRRDDGRR